MIRYRTDGIHPLLNLCTLRGSAFPLGFKFALPSAGIAGFVKWTMLHTDWWSNPEFVSNNAVWTGFTVLVGFLVIFRTSQGYARFVEGCSLTHRMRAEWFDSCAALLAFSAHNKQAFPAEIFMFRSLLIRLFSMLHATALAEIEDTNSSRISDIQAFHYELLDAESIDKDSLEAIRASSSKPELVYYWVNQLVVDGMASGILTVPPPILSRTFQTIANGMVAFHEAVRLSSIQFPFPYAQACDWLLMFHWIFVPLVTAQWTLAIPWAVAFAFIQVFTLWTLNGIAQELENPFGSDYNDLDCLSLHREMNTFLQMLIQPASLRLPILVDPSSQQRRLSERPSTDRLSRFRASFIQVWGADNESEVDVMAGCRTDRTEYGTLQTIGKKSIRMIRRMKHSIEEGVWGTGDDSKTSACTPREQEDPQSINSLEPAAFVMDESDPLRLVSDSSHYYALEKQHTIGRGMSQETQHLETGSSSEMAAVSHIIDGRHGRPNWHSQSIPSTPPDMESLDIPT